MTLRSFCPRDASQRDPCDISSLGGASLGVTSLLPPKCRHQESLSPLRPCSAPLGATSDSNGPERSAELGAPASWSIPGQQSKPPKVTRGSGASVHSCFLELQCPCLTGAPMGVLPCKVRRGCPGGTTGCVQLRPSARKAAVVSVSDRTLGRR